MAEKTRQVHKACGGRRNDLWDGIFARRTQFAIVHHRGGHVEPLQSEEQARQIGGIVGKAAGSQAAIQPGSAFAERR